MANLSGVLAGVPGLAGYLAKQQFDQQQEMGQVQQMGALAQLQASMQNQQAQAQARQRQESARQALAGLGPDATEDQRVNALLPHIGDPDKIAGILQNASLKKAQQEQTKQLAMTRLQQQASQHLDNLAVKIQNAKTAEERSHWERQVAEAQTGFRQQAADIAAGRYNYETGMTVPSLPRPFVPGAVGASPGQAAPTPQPAPSAAPGPSAVPGGAVPLGIRNNNPGNLRPVGSSVGFQQFASPEEGLAALDRNLLAYANTGINTLEGVINRWAPPSENDTGAYVRAAAQRLGIDPKQPLDLKNPIQRQAVATAIMLHENGPQGLFGGGQQQPTPAVPAPAPVTPAAPQAAPQPAPQPASVQIPPDIARLPKKLQDKWLAEQGRKEGGTDEAMKKAAYNAGLKEIAQDEKYLATVNQLESSLKRWQELNAQVETGKVVGHRWGIGQPPFQEMLRLQNDLAVNNFKPGQGQISNFERGLIKGAGPQVTNDKEANDNIVNVMLGAVQNARERGMFREAYLEKNKNLIGADKVWNEYIEKNPRFVSGPNGSLVPNQNRKDWTTLIGGAPQGQSTSQPAPAGVDPKIWAAMTPEERALWK